MTTVKAQREQATEYAAIFVALGDLKRAGRYHDGADLLGDVLDAAPNTGGDTQGYRLAYLITIGAWVISEVIRGRNGCATEFWSLRPACDTAEQQTAAPAMAALRAVVTMLNGDRSAAGDVIRAHVDCHGPESMLDLLGALLGLYEAVLDGRLSC